MYSIGEFSRLGGVSIRTLRYYEEIGLLHPAEVDTATGYRRYAARQLSAEPGHRPERPRHVPRAGRTARGGRHGGGAAGDVGASASPAAAGAGSAGGSSGADRGAAAPYREGG